MSKFNIGDFVIVRSNNSVHHEVGKSKEVYLTIGYRDEIEKGADFICVSTPRKTSRFFKKRFNYSTCKFEYNTYVYFTGIRIKSTKTNKIYEVDADWCTSYAPNSKEYQNAIAYEHFSDELMTNFLNDYSNEMPETWN